MRVVWHINKLSYFLVIGTTVVGFCLFSCICDNDVMIS